MKMKTTSSKIGAVKNAEKEGFFLSLKNFLKRHYRIIILMFVGMSFATALNFLDVATSETIASYRLEDFEIGQISDRTIYAPRTIPPDEMNPVFIEEGEKIIKKGFPITEEAYAKLKKMAESQVYVDWRAFADHELFLFALLALWTIFFSYAPLGRKPLVREFVFQLVCFLLVYAASAFGSKSAVFSSPFMLTVIIPSSLFVLIEAILYGNLSAMLFSIILSLGVFDASNFQAVPFLYTLATSIAASIVVRKIEKRIHMVFVAIIMAFINVVFIYLFKVIFSTQNVSHLFILLGGVAGNGFLSGILALALITPIEWILNTASVFRMMDLLDTNVPILKKLFITASGTYQHSQMVGQLAENACREIGADSLVAKVGAWYHDIGKIDQSEYFAENIPAGSPNKHDDISPNLSASILRSHVRKGVEKAHLLHLPQAVIDIIEEHHGNSVIAYFLDKAQKIDPNVNPADFTYPGHPPRSKESAVVMLADTVEAASRTLENPTEERLDKFIQMLINSKIEHHQLDDCALTFSDITKIKESFVKLLVGVYHNRVKYPKQKDPESSGRKDGKEDKDENPESSSSSSEPSSLRGEEKAEKAEDRTEKTEKPESKADAKKAKAVKKASEEASQEAKIDAARKAVLGDKTLDEVRLNG